MRVIEFVSTMGPSRRAAVTVVEMVLQAEGVEASQVDEITGQLQQHLPAGLKALGLRIDTPIWVALEQRPSAIERLAAYACHLALALQNAAGHKLHFEDFLQDQDPATGQPRYRFIFEHDDIPCGEQAGDLAMRIIAEICPLLNWQPLLHDKEQPLEVCLQEFIHSARPLVTPAETKGLIAAAQARKIPVIRLEREPYGDFPASFRVAPNGMIMLGHSRHKVILDGLFCITRPGPGFAIMKDRRMMWSLVTESGAAGPVSDPMLMASPSTTRVKRSARRLGYPLRLWPMQRSPQALEGWLIENDTVLDQLLSQPGFSNGSFMVEPELPGTALELLFVGGELLTALENGREAELDSNTESVALRIARAFDSGFLMIRFKSGTAAGNSGQPWILTHLDPSPALETLLADRPDLLAAAYDRFLDWLKPPDSPWRIPIVSVTGTNGKTTTSTMVSHIAKAASLCVGLARTTGVDFDNVLKAPGDMSGFLGHCLVFENEQVDLAVLETARGDVLRSGFAFDRSDVAVCTNIANDHLGQHGVETIEQMAAVKRSIVERSTGAVILNADDPYCLDMLPHLPGRTIYLTSYQDNAEAVRQKAPLEIRSDLRVINIESHAAADWIILHESGTATPVVPVNDIPATFKGAALHNISNAMQAIGAASALGLNLDIIRGAMSNFETNFDTLPGRLNIHDNGRFLTILDFAHNAHGIQQLVNFTDQLPCQGRRIVCLGVSPNASEAAARAAGVAAAGNFDYYICASRESDNPNVKIDTNAAMRQGLISSGVAENVIEIISDQDRMVYYAISLCEPGDLLVIKPSVSAIDAAWQKIINS